MNRVTSRLVIPSRPVLGLQYMQKNNLLSKNPQCSGGVGRIHHVGCQNGAIKSALTNNTRPDMDNNTMPDMDNNTQDCKSCDGKDGKGCVMKLPSGSYNNICCTGSPDSTGMGCDNNNKICGIGGATSLCGKVILSCSHSPSIIEQIRQVYENKNITSFADIRKYCMVGTDYLLKPGDLKVWPGYKWDDFWNVLNVFIDPHMDMRQPPIPGGGGSDDVSNIYLGTSAEEGAVIVSGFFAQTLYESNNYSVCDETNFSGSSGTNSCGQYGHDYTNGQGYTCTCCDENENNPHPKKKSGCPYGPNGDTKPTMQPPCYGNAGCMDFCENDFSLTIDSSMNSNILTVIGETFLSCKAGTDTSGCCWWGRGPTQLTGRNAIKLFQNFLNSNSSILGIVQDKNKVATSLCKNPGLICQYNSVNGDIIRTDKGYALVWLAALWDWTISAQNSNGCVQTDHPFITQLNAFMKEKDNGKLKTYNIPTDFAKNIDGLDIPGCDCSTPEGSKICSEASWLSGVGNGINNGIWANNAQQNNLRVCGNIKLLTQIKLMQETPMPRPKEYLDCNPNKTKTF